MVYHGCRNRLFPRNIYEVDWIQVWEVQSWWWMIHSEWPLAILLNFIFNIIVCCQQWATSVPSPDCPHRYTVDWTLKPIIYHLCWIPRAIKCSLFILPTQNLPSSFLPSSSFKFMFFFFHWVATINVWLICHYLGDLAFYINPTSYRIDKNTP